MNPLTKKLIVAICFMCVIVVITGFTHFGNEYCDETGMEEWPRWYPNVFENSCIKVININGWLYKISNSSWETRLVDIEIVNPENGMERNRYTYHLNFYGKGIQKVTFDKMMHITIRAANGDLLCRGTLPKETK